MRPALLALVLCAGPASLAAQSSQFGIRGLGIPVRPLSPRATATGGAFALFDTESSANPASIGSILTFSALLSSTQSFRSSTNEFGKTTGKDARFPQVFVAGPVGDRPIAVSFSISGYTDRSFSLGTTDTIVLRDVPVAVFDTLSSRGGLSDVRAAAAWRVSRNLHLGLGLHAITGSNRIRNQRVFSDSNYVSAAEVSEISYLGLGASIGAVVRVIPRVSIAATFRNDGHVKVDRDSTRIARTNLPTSLGLGIRWEPSIKTTWVASYQRRNWSASDADIKAQGGVGAEDAYEISTGIEFLRDPRNPGHRPWRLGGHYATLPFPQLPGRRPHEYGLSVGTGFRFTQGRGGIDLALQQLWRSDGNGATERATALTLGISIRP